MKIFYKISKERICANNMQINYYFHEKPFVFNNFNRLDIFKNILNQIVINLELEPKKYITKTDQNELIPLRKQIIEILDNELLKFPVKSFVKQVFSIISDKIYKKDCLIFIKENNINNMLMFQDIQEINLEIKVLKYILERRLELDYNHSVTKGKKSLEYVMDIATTLYNFNLCMDFMYYELEFGYIEIDKMFNVKTHFKQTQYNLKNIENKYDASDRIIDKKIIEEYCTNFKKDMGFDFFDFTEISSCLCIDIPQKLIMGFKNNIIKIRKDRLIKLIKKYNQRNLSIETINNIINYFIIDKKNVTAIYKSENQFNRIDQRPILCYQNTLYYSPALLSQVYTFFMHSIFNYYFPYKCNISNIEKTINKVKKISEKTIVLDASEIIKKNIVGVVFVNKKLHQINPKIDKNYSESIGDYDILALDINRKAIYNIEVKNLKLFSTVYEMYKQYKEFYDIHKYEYKFSKRIDALKKYYKIIFANCFMTNIDSYKIYNIILTNKNFIPKSSNNKNIIYMSYAMLEDFLNFDSIMSNIKNNFIII